MTLPSIHRNGTHPDTLYEGYARAALAITEALVWLEAAAPNARDYYTQAPYAWRGAQEEHEARLRILRTVRDELNTILEHVAGATWGPDA